MNCAFNGLFSLIKITSVTPIKPHVTKLGIGRVWLIPCLSFLYNFGPTIKSKSLIWQATYKIVTSHTIKGLTLRLYVMFK